MSARFYNCLTLLVQAMQFRQRLCVLALETQVFALALDLELQEEWEESEGRLRTWSRWHSSLPSMTRVIEQPPVYAPGLFGP